MTSIFRRSSPYVFALFPLNFGNNSDTPTVNTYMDMKPSNDTPLERVKKIFTRSEYDEISQELRYCIHLTTTGIIIGAIYGGVIRGRTAFINFIDNNEATMFRNHLDAKRKLQDKMFINIFKGAYQWGWRVGFFLSIYSLTATVVSVTREKSGILEHTDGGFLAGAIYNMKNGIRGFIVGGVLGGVLGTFFGTIFYLLLLMTGHTVEELRFWTAEWKKNREETVAQIQRKHRVKKDEEEIIKLAEEMTAKEIMK